MIRILAKLLVIFVLVYAGVSIWYGRLEENLKQPPAVSRQPVTTPAPEKKTETLRKSDDYSIIVRRNIFQAVLEKTEKVVEEVKPEVLEPTKLKLSLMGTVFGNERDARAIISDDLKRQQDIYQVGDSIQGAMIKTIERGKVVLVVNGRDEVLTLKDREGGGPAYQPSATDFYQEPPEPQVEEQQAEQQPQVQQNQQPAVSPRQRIVRPRPVRRPVNRQQPRTQPGSGYGESGTQ